MRTRNPIILEYILTKIQDSPQDISTKLVERFSISRQVAQGYLNHLVKTGALENIGEARKPYYKLSHFSETYAVPSKNVSFSYQILEDLKEDEIWANDLKHCFEKLPKNIQQIWNYASTEMINNAIDHSQSARLDIEVVKLKDTHVLRIRDYGIGVFKNIQINKKFIRIEDAIQQLMKGKYTTFPERHSGQGIFFTSRICSHFTIFSGLHGLIRKGQDGIPETVLLPEAVEGTAIELVVLDNSTVKTRDVFNQFVSDLDDYDFSKTILHLSPQEDWVARSQAKKLMDGLEKYETVVLDFKGIQSIGQGFADEVFRVWRKSHKQTQLIPLNTEGFVSQMIQRAIFTP